MCNVYIPLEKRRRVVGECVEDWIGQESELVELRIGRSNNTENSESLITYVRSAIFKSQSSIDSDTKTGFLVSVTLQVEGQGND